MGAIASRNKRARAMKKLRVPAIHELRYQRALTGAMRTLHDAALEWLRPKLEVIAKKDGTRFDAMIADDFEKKVRELAASLASSVSPAFTQLATAVAKSNARALRSMGLDVRDELGTTLDHIREYNINLMRNAADDFADQVKGVLNDPANWGLRVEELSSLVQERADVSESRAALIARDQTSKTNGLINQTRQQAAGINSYVWSGSLDERERETHVDNEGQTFSWYSPPPETGHPTEDVNCRCCAIPVLPGEDDDE